MDARTKYITNLRNKGYSTNFTSTSSAHILSDHKKLYKPGQIKITSFLTFSPETDPEDFSIMYAIETSDGKKGILIDEHCKSPDSRVEKFINCVKEARQIKKKSWFTHPWQKMFKVGFSMNL